MYVIVNQDDTTQFWCAASKSFQPMVSGLYTEYSLHRNATRTLNTLRQSFGFRAEIVDKMKALNEAWR